MIPRLFLENTGTKSQNVSVQNVKGGGAGADEELRKRKALSR